MNNLEYLNHISKDNRPVAPVKKSHKGLFVLLGKILVIGTLLFVLLVGIASLVKNLSGRPLEVAKELNYRINNLSNVTSTYTNSLKSSQLRAINLSLSGALANSSRQLVTYLYAQAPADDTSPLTPSTVFITQESVTFNNLYNQLNTAKLNGTLDRTYPPLIHAQVSLLMAMAGDLKARNNDPTVHQICDTLYSNLASIEQALANYNSK